MLAYSKPSNGKVQWYQDETGRIMNPVDPDDMTKGLRFYEVLPHPTQGNPVIYQATGGEVFLTVIVGPMLIVCEPETVYGENMDVVGQFRVVRRSLDNPDTIVPADKTFLGEVYANSQRIVGAPERLYLVRLASPPDGKFVFRTVREVIQSRDGFGIVAVAKALELGLLELK